MKRVLVLFVALLTVAVSFASKIERVEPTFWWTGMKNEKLQIMVYGENLAGLSPSIDYAGVTLLETINVDSPNYLFLYLTISEDAKAGTFPITFKEGKKVKLTVDYTLKERDPNSSQKPGYTTEDVIYLVTPDRFVNGDPSNDNIEGMPDKVNRDNLNNGRHGGDIRGVINSLDYLDDLGFTAVWVNPLLENNMKDFSYHGYSTTDFYKVDPRFGSNEEYLELADTAREKGMKIIMDMIMNHCGSEHWWMSDLPTKDWINFQDSDYIGCNHIRTTLRDPYTSEIDKVHFTDGWFVPTMPDMNQRNPLLSDYLIQNTLWWIEYLGLAGIRMDTYPYSDKEFMAKWTHAIVDEYPNFKTVGEEWSIDPTVLAYWQIGKDNHDGYKSYLSGLLDFPLQDAVVKGLKDAEGHEKGIASIYLMLSRDYLYPNAYDHVVFPDNHDMSRIFTQLDEDYDLYKLAMVFFSTTRGTPQIYYGTEILMSNKGTDSHGVIRTGFPGGWEGDTVNAFTGEGLTDQQKDAQAFVKRLLNWRKTSDAVHNGKIMHYYPRHGVYTYFRYTDDEKVMVIMNKSDKEQTLDTGYYAERIAKGENAVDILTDQAYTIGETITIAPKTVVVLDFK